MKELRNHLRYELIMPTKRDNEIKEFAIGTKIEYNSKLYEVVEQKYCNECSIADICPTNDVVKHTDYRNVLSRNERVKIFGECSPIKRKDNKSIVFKEIPINISKDKYYKISPLFRDDNPSKLKSVEFDLPNGYVIDKDNSDLDKGIIRFKRNWLSIEEVYDALFEREKVTYRQNLKDFSNIKMLAIANLMDIARYFNGDLNYSTKCNDIGYSIAYDDSTKEPCYLTRTENPDTDIYYGNVVFKNEADAQYIIDNPNFRDILNEIFKV